MEINLKDAVQMFRDMSPTEMASDERLNGYMEKVEQSGMESLQSISPDELAGAVSLMESVVMADLLADGRLDLAMTLMKNEQTFAGSMVVALKFAVGLAIMEEWR